MTAGGALLLDRSMVARWLDVVESVPARSASDVRMRDELRKALAVPFAIAAATRAADALARHAMSPVSHADTDQADAVPFGHELTTRAAAAALGVCTRTVRRWCYLGEHHPNRLRSRRRRGVLLVSGFDVDARVGG